MCLKYDKIASSVVMSDIHVYIMYKSNIVLVVSNAHEVLLYRHVACFLTKYSS